VPIREDCGRGDAPHLMAGKEEKWPADAAGPLLECVERLKKSYTIRKSGLFRRWEVPARE